MTCNLSGLENMAKKMIDNGESSPKIAAFTLDFVGRTLLRLTDAATEVYPDARVLYSGGVMSNSIIKNMLRTDKRYFAEPQLSADNAVGTALLTKDRHTAQK